MQKQLNLLNNADNSTAIIDQLVDYAEHELEFYGDRENYIAVDNVVEELAAKGYEVSRSDVNDAVAKYGNGDYGDWHVNVELDRNPKQANYIITHAFG